MEIDAQTIRTIASDIVLIAIGLLAATLIVIVPTWKRFVTYWEHTPKETWNMALRATLLIIAMPFLHAVSGLVASWLFPSNWLIAWENLFVLLILLVFALVLPFIVPVMVRNLREDIEWVWAKFRRTEVPVRTAPPDIAKELGVIAALICFQFTILVLLLILLVTIKVAVNADFGGQYTQDNFNSIRVLIISAPLTFASGIGCLAASYGAELRQSKRDYKDGKWT